MQKAPYNNSRISKQIMPSLELSTGFRFYHVGMTLIIQLGIILLHDPATLIQLMQWKLHVFIYNLSIGFFIALSAIARWPGPVLGETQASYCHHNQLHFSLIIDLKYHTNCLTDIKECLLSKNICILSTKIYSLYFGLSIMEHLSFLISTCKRSAPIVCNIHWKPLNLESLKNYRRHFLLL